MPQKKTGKGKQNVDKQVCVTHTELEMERPDPLPYFVSYNGEKIGGIRVLFVTHSKAAGLLIILWLHTTVHSVPTSHNAFLLLGYFVHYCHNCG